MRDNRGYGDPLKGSLDLELLLILTWTRGRKEIDGIATMW